jgi:hypothetical protein
MNAKECVEYDKSAQTHGDGNMSWMQTYTGRKFSLVDPQPEDVDIVDIVASLGNIVRFNGHCGGNYTVLQHSVQVAELCNQEFRFDGLMHDAGEAYYGDITRPQKIVLNELSDGRIAEWMKRIDRVVAIALGFVFPTPLAVKHFDNVMLATEARDLMTDSPKPWEELPPPLPDVLRVWSPQESYTRFVRLYHQFRPNSKGTNRCPPYLTRPKSKQKTS